MSNTSQSPFTKTLTGASLTILNEHGYCSVSIAWLSGTVTVTGMGKVGATSSDAVTLSSSNTTVTLITDASQINNLTIDASAGSCAIVAAN